jgi:7-carboxy-7-deazaguanine synthase
MNLFVINEMKTANTLFNISEIFYSIQGEGTRTGMPCVFVRLQGCNFRCSWCDTPYALESNEDAEWLTGEQILEKAKSYNCTFIEFTGGEPLFQKEAVELINDFVDSDFLVAIETNGFHSFENLNSKAVKIMDIKCPGSRMQTFNNLENLKYLTKNDELKFVILDKIDFDWSVEFIQSHKLFDKVGTILFSPVFGLLEPVNLAEWILNTKLPIRLQLQIHKFIWEPNTRGV